MTQSDFMFFPIFRRRSQMLGIPVTSLQKNTSQQLTCRVEILAGQRKLTPKFRNLRCEIFLLSDYQSPTLVDARSHAKFCFQANLWLAEKYPLSLQEQIMPIVDLMAISSSHFAKLKDFIQMQLPAGFPVKIGMITERDKSQIRITNIFWWWCSALQQS